MSFFKGLRDSFNHGVDLAVADVNGTRRPKNPLDIEAKKRLIDRIRSDQLSTKELLELAELLGVDTSPTPKK